MAIALKVPDPKKHVTNCDDEKPPVNGICTYNAQTNICVYTHLPDL